MFFALIDTVRQVPRRAALRYISNLVMSHYVLPKLETFAAARLEAASFREDALDVQ